MKMSGWIIIFFFFNGYFILMHGGLVHENRTQSGNGNKTNDAKTRFEGHNIAVELISVIIIILCMYMRTSQLLKITIN